MTYIIWFVLVVATLYFYFEKRFQRIEKHLNLPEVNYFRRKQVSCKTEIVIIPQWDEIINWCLPEYKGQDEKRAEFIENLYKEKDINVNKKDSLYGQDFSFTHFYDAVSGIQQIWSDSGKTFLDEMEIRGDMFKQEYSNKKEIQFEFPKDLMGGKYTHGMPSMIINPWSIGFMSHLPDGAMRDVDTISEIPYNNIVHFLTTEIKNRDQWVGEFMVKKFPKELQEELNKYKVEYDSSQYENSWWDDGPSKELLKSEWLEKEGIELYDERMGWHSFKTPYYEVSIRIKFFEP